MDNEGEYDLSAGRFRGTAGTNGMAGKAAASAKETRAAATETRSAAMKTGEAGDL